MCGDSRSHGLTKGGIFVVTGLRLISLPAACKVPVHFCGACIYIERPLCPVYGDVPLFLFAPSGHPVARSGRFFLRRRASRTHPNSGFSPLQSNKSFSDFDFSSHETTLKSSKVWNRTTIMVFHWIWLH